jgi:predicted HTH transcriptional regulator
MSKKDKNLTVFIEALLYILSMEMTNLENQVINIYENKVEKKGKLSIELNERQIQILEYLQINQKVTRRKYAKIMDVSFMTAYRDLNELLDKGYIKQKGVGRGTFYVLDKDNDEVLKEIPTFVDLSLN